MSRIPKYQSEPVYGALRERYRAPEYALFWEVANGTGSNIRRYADALAMSLFPSRGLTMNGFEIKVSRGDWKRELDQPHKAEEGIFKYCDHWWIVTPPGIVMPGELPPTWGHLEFQIALKEGETSKLRQKVNAPKLEAQPMTRSFIAALLRRADEAVKNRIDNEVRARTQALEDKLARVRNDNETAIQEEVDLRMKRNDERFKKVKEFEEILGIPLSGYNANPGDARILKAMKAAGYAAAYGGLEYLAKQLDEACTGIRKSLAEFDELAPPPKKEDAA